MIIEDHRFAPLDDDDEQPREHPLSDDELFGGPIAPLFVANCGEFFAGGELQGERFIGAVVAGRSLRQGLIGSGLVRRWYVITKTDEPTALDRTPEAVLREHRVPMQTYWRIPADEADILCHHGFIHAFVSTGLTNPHNLLFRATTQARVPHMAFVHSIADQSAEFLGFYAGQSFAFDVLVSPSHCGKRVLQSHFERLHEAVGSAPFHGEIAVIPHGVHVGPLGDRQQARATLRWNEQVLLLLQRFDQDYKADLGPVLKVLLQLPQARLVIAGADNGAYHAAVQSYAEELGISDRLEVRPNVTEPTKALLLAGADVFLAVADNVQETHGLSLLEAMAAGLPDDATARDGFNETVGDGGLLVPTAWHPPAPSIAATSVPNLGSIRPLSLQPQHVRFEIEALAKAIGQVTPQMGERGRQRVSAEFDAQKNAKKAAELLVAKTHEAAATEVTWRPHLGAHWLRDYGHYAGTISSQAIRAVPGTLGVQQHGAIDRALRGRMRELVQRAHELAQGQSLAALTNTLCEEFPKISREGVERMLFSALKHGWLTSYSG